MSIVKHKRGSAAEVSVHREAELHALAEKPTRKLTIAIFQQRMGRCGTTRCAASSIDR
jgi:hypothetical protein